MSYASQAIKTVRPLHREMIRRIVYGPPRQTQKQIAEELGFDEHRFSIIVRSPLFQLELKKEQRRKDENLREETRERTYGKIIDAAEKAIDLHASMIDGKIAFTDADGVTAYVDLPFNLRQASATAVANLFLRLTRGAPLSPEEELNVPYEKKLKEVIIRQTEIVTKGGGNEGEKLSAEEVGELLETSYLPEEELSDGSDGSDGVEEELAE